MTAALGANWPVWLVTFVLIVAAVIDGWKLKVPNWLTFPMVISGWIYSTYALGWSGLLWSILGTIVGLALLMVPYAIGGMGAGDVKLMGGVGAWVFPEATFYAFCATAIIGGALAIVMVLWQRGWAHHQNQFWSIVNEITTIRDPEKLATIAAERKSSMLLLPYGIPIALGSITYFALAGMLL